MSNINNPEYVRWQGIDKTEWLDRVDNATARYTTTKRGKRIENTPLYNIGSAQWYREHLPPINVAHLSTNNITIDSGYQLETWCPLELVDGTIIGTRKQYQGSKHWKEFSRQCKTALPYECACGVNASLSLHHKTYTRIGQEKLEDVVWLCSGCHKALHFSLTYDRSMSLVTATNNLLQNVRMLKKHSHSFGLIFKDGWWYNNSFVHEHNRLTRGLASVLSNNVINTSVNKDALITIINHWHENSYYRTYDYFRYSENNY